MGSLSLTMLGIIVLFCVASVLASEAEEDIASASCCKELNLDSMGFTESYQGDRLGSYSLTGSSEGGRPVYRQNSGVNYLYSLTSLDLWMVGPTLGENYGGILNRNNGICPDQLPDYWEYWSDWTEEWESGFSFEATCSGGPGPNPNTTPSPNYEPCTWGSSCDFCDVWSEANGVRYCCANDCNSGGISVSTENGEVQCYCYH